MEIYTSKEFIFVTTFAKIPVGIYMLELHVALNMCLPFMCAFYMPFMCAFYIFAQRSKLLI